MRSILISAGLLASVITSALIVGSHSYFGASSGTVTGVALIALGTVSVVGMLIGHARWARRLGAMLAGIAIGVSTMAGQNLVFLLAALVAGITLTGLIGPGMRGTVRDLPPALGPPPEAVVLPLVLIGSPIVVAVTQAPDLDVVGWVAALTSWAGAIIYAKAAWGALVMVRIVVPLALAAAAMVDWPARIGLFWLSIAIALVAWRTNSRVAVRPLIERGTETPVLPEMVSEQLLDLAGYDWRGRRKDTEQ